jgi:Icc-related predicted phosphoesterase
MTTFCTISDTHNMHLEIERYIPKADIIFHTGDCTGTGTTKQIREFCEWYGSLPHKHKILIAGNHDWGFEKDRAKHEKICEDNGIIYLQDSSVTIEGIKIHGSPQTPEFCNWAFNCWRNEKEYTWDRQQGHYGKGYECITKYWDMIPKDTDVLLTHGPPYDILDKCPRPVGCEELRKKVMEIEPKFHIFGHIHESAGELFHDWTDPEIEHLDTFFINAARLDGMYQPLHYATNVYDYEKQKVIA